MSITGKRELAVILAGVGIAAVSTWRILNPMTTAPADAVVMDRRPAPAFELYDQNSRLVKLSAYLNRHAVVLIFFDRSDHLDEIPLLQKIAEYQTALRQTNVVVIAVSNALPQEIRRLTEQPLPFPVLSDVSAGSPGSPSVVWHVAKPRPDAENGPATIQQAMFLIDESGLVAWDKDHPRPIDQPRMLLSRLLAGEI